MKKHLGWILAAVAMVALLGGCAAPSQGGKQPCAYPSPYSC